MSSPPSTRPSFDDPWGWGEDGGTSVEVADRRPGADARPVRGTKVSTCRICREQIELRRDVWEHSSTGIWADRPYRHKAQPPLPRRVARALFKRYVRKPLVRLVLIIVTPFLLLGGVLVALLMAYSAGVSPPITQPSAAEVSDIPGNYLDLYEQAATAYDLDWAVLAGIGKVECNHGQLELEGCDPPGSVNQAGARGPMQFLGSTWRAGADTFDPDVAGDPVPAGQESRGYATDGDGDGLADPWSAADAIHAAARYLRSHGAPADYNAAIWAYNHSDAYRAEVLRWADSYRQAVQPAGAPGSVAVPGSVSLATVRGITVHTSIAGQLDAMVAAAQADGVTLSGSGYRSPEAQVRLRRAHCGTSQYAIYEMPSSRCSPPTARPGTSMHEMGLAVDFANCSSRSTACYRWLSGNAARFGFYNLPSESWHWSIDGS